jgi:hypothetical protein
LKEDAVVVVVVDLGVAVNVHDHDQVNDHEPAGELP